MKKMNLILANAFSINMITSSEKLEFIQIKNIDEFLQNNYIIDNAIGHKETDSVVLRILNPLIPPHRQIPNGERKSITLNNPKRKADALNGLLVAQYKGPRLQEGATTLPENATIEFWVVIRPETINNCPSCGGSFMIDLHCPYCAGDGV